MNEFGTQQKVRLVLTISASVKMSKTITLEHTKYYHTKYYQKDPWGQNLVEQLPASNM